jgi:tRNA splicing endonuclease
LQYSDGSEATSTAQSQPKWWNGLLTSAEGASATLQSSPHPDVKPKPIDASAPPTDEQERVDDYLEFLDRRYRRLHEDESEQETKTTGGGFSALQWLGLSEKKPSRNDVALSEQKKEDALYVLGVAGLASQKLLQKHHLATQEKIQRVQQESITSIPALENVMDALVVEQDASVEQQELSKSQKLANQVLLPIVRVLYVIELQKRLFLRAQGRNLKTILGFVARQLAKGSRSALEFGGGRANLVRTMAIATGLILFMRPLLEAVLRERAMPL